MTIEKMLTSGKAGDRHFVVRLPKQTDGVQFPMRSQSTFGGLRGTHTFPRAFLRLVVEF